MCAQIADAADDSGNPPRLQAMISAGDAQRDAPLKSADFFDVEKSPAMTFTSTQVVPNGDGGYNATGNLALH
jgi:polyisoprenoid-binding protein YceI